MLGVVSPGQPDSHGEVVRGMLDLMGGGFRRTRCRFGGADRTRAKSGKAAFPAVTDDKTHGSREFSAVQSKARSERTTGLLVALEG